MPSYKLTYFDAKGLAETSRLIFAAAGETFEDVRVEREAWPELKPKMPFKAIPVLEFDGHIISESRVIARYLAKQFGLAGKTDVEVAMADMVAEASTDIMTKLGGVMLENDETAKAQKTKKLTEEELPLILGGVEEILKKNNEGMGFLVGKEMTWADLHFLAMTDPVAGLFADVLAKFPLCVALRTRVAELPKIAAWIKTRPVTDY